MEKRAVALISGGLDSALAAKMIKDQGIEVLGLHLLHPFLAPGAGSFPALRVCREIGIPLRVVYRGREFLDLVEKPHFGYGANLNPCIDCRIFVFGVAREEMEKQRASFLISGEVVGQRPMSQRAGTIRMIERVSGVEGLVLRPLSARRFPPTGPEREGIVAREKLYSISGRGRKEQISRAREMGLSGFSPPAGGCLLTDPAFCRRLSDLLHHQERLGLGEVKLLRRGRHFRLGPETKLIVGRDHRENLILRAYNLKRRPYLIPENFPGPEVAVRGKYSSPVREIAGRIIHRYGKPPDSEARIREILPPNRESVFSVSNPVEEEELEKWRI